MHNGKKSVRKLRLNGIVLVTGTHVNVNQISKTWQPYHCDQQSLRSACAYALEYSMSVKLLTEHHLEFLSCTGTSESTLVKMPHCWKSHVVAQIPWLFSWGFVFLFHLFLVSHRHSESLTSQLYVVVSVFPSLI